MKTESQKPNYRIYDRTGGGVTHDIYADSLEDAIEQGREWIEEGDWSGGNNEDENGGKTYRTVKLECEVGEIIRETYYVDIYCSGSPRDLRGPMTEDEARALCDGEEVSIEPYAGIVEQIKSRHDGADVEIIGAWAESEDSEDYRAIYRVSGVDVDSDEINDDATRNAYCHDCSGQHSDELPECEASTDGEHDWQSDYEVVGGIRENPGVWSDGGTRMGYRECCAKCGYYKHTSDPGCQRNPGEALETITISPRAEKSEAWLKEQHEEDGWLPDWLAEYLGCAPTVRMTEAEAKEWVSAHDDSDHLDEDDLEHAFAAIMGRRANDADRAEGLWSHLCASEKNE